MQSLSMFAHKMSLSLHMCMCLCLSLLVFAHVSLLVPACIRVFACVFQVVSGACFDCLV